MQSNQWKHPGSPPKKFKSVHSAGKVMTSIFLDSQRVIMIDYLEQICTMRGANYAGKLRQLRQEISRKRRRKLIGSVLLILDNAPAHTSQVAMAAATECGFVISSLPSYSPDMAPSDLYMFPNLKSYLCGTQYGSSESVIEAVNEYLGDPERASLEGIRKLKQR